MEHAGPQIRLAARRPVSHSHLLLPSPSTPAAHHPPSHAYRNRRRRRFQESVPPHSPVPRQLTSLVIVAYQTSSATARITIRPGSKTMLLANTTMLSHRPSPANSNSNSSNVPNSIHVIGMPAMASRHRDTEAPPSIRRKWSRSFRRSVRRRARCLSTRAWKTTNSLRRWESKYSSRSGLLLPVPPPCTVRYVV